VGVSIFFDREEGGFAGGINEWGGSRLDNLRLWRGDGWVLRFGLEACPKQETHYYEQDQKRLPRIARIDAKCSGMQRHVNWCQVRGCLEAG
jgi:hypothetical protein